LYPGFGPSSNAIVIHCGDAASVKVNILDYGVVDTFG
jgi:hypothetical protein